MQQANDLFHLSINMQSVNPGCVHISCVMQPWAIDQYRQSKQGSDVYIYMFCILGTGYIKITFLLCSFEDFVFKSQNTQLHNNRLAGEIICFTRHCCKVWCLEFTYSFFSPEASIGPWVLLPASVRPSIRPSVRHQVCPHDNSSPVQARIPKFGP